MVNMSGFHYILRIDDEFLTADDWTLWNTAYYSDGAGAVVWCHKCLRQQNDKIESNRVCSSGSQTICSERRWAHFVIDSSKSGATIQQQQGRHKAGVCRSYNVIVNDCYSYLRRQGDNMAIDNGIVSEANVVMTNAREILINMKEWSCICTSVCIIISAGVSVPAKKLVQ